MPFRNSTRCLGIVALLLLLQSGYSSGTGAAAQGYRLTQAGRALVSIIHGTGDEFAARRLVGELRKYSDPPPLLGGLQVPENVDHTTIYIGTLKSNPSMAQVAAALGWTQDVQKLGTESYLLRSGVLNGHPVIVLAGGDRVGTLYAESDFRNYYLQRADGDLWALPLDFVEVPKLKYRWFWNWDVRTNWDLLDHDDVYNEDELLVPSYSGRPYRKRPEAFLKNMKLCVDYMSEHKLNGLIIWGFLRDNHGGAKASRELCEYANERGVRILPGLKIDRGHGGIYHEGRNEFSLETRAEKYPNLRTMDKNGNYVDRTLCAQKPENRTWLRRGFRWLFSEFDVGGVNLEFAEGENCYCPDCVKARQSQSGNEGDMFKDMARIMPFVVKSVHDLDHGAWISYASFGPFKPEMQSEVPLHILAVPDYAICQWTLTPMLRDLIPSRREDSSQRWPDGLRPPGKESIGYIKCNAFYTHNQKGFFVDAFRESARRAYRNGLKGLDIYGEESADFPNVEFNYLAFAEFSFNPEMTEADFLRRRVAPLYGGEEAGKLVLEIARRVGPVRVGQNPIGHDKILELAYRGHRLSAEYAKQRWERMIHFLKDVLPE